MRVLIVDDNPKVANHLARVFEETYQVECIYDYYEAKERLSYTEYDVVCLDIDLGVGTLDGVSLCREVRKCCPEAILIMFTGQTIDASLVARMLEAGADSFVEKTSSASVLLEKSLALIEDSRKQRKNQVDLGKPIYMSMQLDENNLSAVIDGETRLLDPMPFRILQELLERPNQFVHTNTLIRWVKNPMTHTGISIKVHISHIRKAITPYGKHIRNRWGGWYGFFEEV